MTEGTRKLNLLRGISHQGSIAAVQKILQKAEKQAFEKYGEGITNYTNTYAKFPGVTPFVEYLAERHGMSSEQDSDRIYILEGGMHANTMVFNALGTEKPILVDEFLYDRCLETLILLGFKVVGVPMDENGTDTEALENLIQKYKPSAFWSNITTPRGCMLPWTMCGKRQRSAKNTMCCGTSMMPMRIAAWGLRALRMKALWTFQTRP
jgi:DNA-binding transcriptional MocR family regulator